MAFGFGNRYSLKCSNLLAALRTRAIHWAHATFVLSLEAETPLWSLGANIVCDGCPSFVPSLPGRFFLKFESAGTQAARCLPSNDNAGPNDQRLPRVCAVVRDSAASLPRQAATRKSRHHVSCAEGRDPDRRDPRLQRHEIIRGSFPEEHWTHDEFVSKEPLLSASIFAGRSPVKSIPAPTPDEVRNECSS
jgi:hypothetical protein